MSFSSLAKSLVVYTPNKPLLLGSLSSSRSIVRLIAKDKKLGSFDSRDAPLQPVNPYNLPAKANNGAGKHPFCSFFLFYNFKSILLF